MTWHESLRDSLVAPLDYEEPAHGAYIDDGSQRWVLGTIIGALCVVVGVAAWAVL